jgi:hypothetical protein
MRQRQRVSVRLLALLAGAALSAWSASRAVAASDVFDRAACLARDAGAADVRLSSHAGADRYDLGWMGEAEHFGKHPYVVHVGDPESPRSLIEHDRLVLPGLPDEWVAAPRGPDLVLCARRLPAVVVIERQFCSGPLSAVEVANGEIEEITFLGGVSWLADDLTTQIEGAAVPAELAEDLRHEVAMASPARHARDPDDPRVIVYAGEVETLVGRWSIVPMSRALGGPAAAAPGCHAHHADLRARIMPTNRSNR